MRALTAILAIIMCLAPWSGDVLAEGKKAHSTVQSKKDDVDKSIVDKIRGRKAPPNTTEQSPSATSGGAVKTK